ncbi:haloacid dehalogenase-like hydrolase family protein, partial [Vibrio parahaemolyticus V-223/04]
VVWIQSFSTCFCNWKSKVFCSPLRLVVSITVCETRSRQSKIECCMWPKMAPW